MRFQLLITILHSERCKLDTFLFLNNVSDAQSHLCTIQQSTNRPSAALVVGTNDLFVMYITYLPLYFKAYTLHSRIV